MTPCEHVYGILRNHGVTVQKLRSNKKKLLDIK
ncbi:hypothetical protein A2U01_0075271, partial [Trifolium medium]|nr:hypothetical protein [Trifolium medium]